MVSERGLVTLTILLIVLAAMGIGYVAAKIDDRPADCQAQNMDVRCVFVGEP